MFVRRKNDSYMAKRIQNHTKSKFWEKYSDYQFILWMWMLGDTAMMWAPVELANSGYYLHSLTYLLTVIIVATPLLFSEICLAQYTNCDILSMWNYFPILRSLGYGTIYMVAVKIVYMLVLCTWTLIYLVHSAISPAPWNTCTEYNSNSMEIICMVKKKNTSIFQNCIEIQNVYGGDCGVKTASRWFFDTQIGNCVTSTWPNCLPSVRETVALWCIGATLFVLTLKRKFLRIGLKLALIYVTVGIVVLVCVALSTGGTWYSSSVTIEWANYSLDSLCLVLTKAFLAVGAGCGVAGAWSSGAEFRSPACMTAVSTSMLAVLLSLLLSFVTFSGIKTMSFYHGDEENIVELGDNFFFTPFASMTETLGYFDDYNFAGFIWFSITFLGMFANTWLLFSFLMEYLVNNFLFVQRHHKSSSMLLMVMLVLLSYPCFCSDVTPALLDVAETVQIVTSLMFSISLYWIYGYYNHSVDIIFMIGVKTNYFLKFCWILNPIFILFISIIKCSFFSIHEYNNSVIIEPIGMYVNVLIYTIFMGIYGITILIPLFIQLVLYLSDRKCKALFIPSDDWGPKDEILFKSRKMFVPEIMTTEFLYRQVKKHGYTKRNRIHVMKEPSLESDVSYCLQPTEWSVMTSN